MHEHQSHNTKQQSPSSRSFGLVFSCFFLIIGLLPLASSGTIKIWSLCLSAVFLFLALAIPKGLTPLARCWMWFGLLLHRIMNPIVLGILFFAILTPVAILKRLFGKPSFAISFDQSARSYWAPRAAKKHTDMKNQF